MNFRLLIPILVLAVVIIVAGCTAAKDKSSSDQAPVCNKPYILVGSSCCLDNNDNGICDKDEEQPKVEAKACPASCDDGFQYTKDYCSEETNFECKHETIKNVCGNQICEPENKENTFTCATDCQRKTCTTNEQCSDNNVCTKDTCTQGYCYNVELKGGVCYIGQNYTGTPGSGAKVTLKGYYTTGTNKVAVAGEVQNTDTTSLKDITVSVTLNVWTSGITSKVVPFETKKVKTSIPVIAAGNHSPFVAEFEDVDTKISDANAVVFSYTATSEIPSKTITARIDEYDKKNFLYSVRVENTGFADVFQPRVYYLLVEEGTSNVLRYGQLSLPDTIKGRTSSTQSFVTVTVNGTSLSSFKVYPYSGTE